ncbi:MAG TPA: PIG-L family deacetylase, partial [Pyrinomonadaceae bacterium]|nr:PIG-L family deacetylase [Pyrinomonadaceae bacterium]
MKSRIQESGVGIQKGFGFAQRAMRSCFVFALFVLIAAVSFASAQQASAPAQDSESVELYQALLDLQNPWTVMCVAAHPDDEDGTTLTILRHKYGVHTVSVFSTYGEGGQNDIGPELYEELGAIRARETKEAALVQGSEPYFLGLRDFGFSKSADEAFRVWGHDEALRRMVLKIRELRPDVIITNHDTVTGHGHHQATGRLVLEAFDAAADPQRFPEQLKNGVTPWQVKRLFVRFQFEGSGSKAAEEEAQRTGKVVSINPNERDPVRGMTYAEEALQALQHHATQGPWPKTLPPGGRPVIRYR